ncbi:MAG: geranylgeranyl reductase [Planctomycetaceae bacterium]|nr:geranylgeranyl reductase [Planctomycetaceae bacterium]
MHRCDVLIVGAGPAGSTCASRLKAAGLDCLVLDRKTFPRDKTCAGWVTPPVFELLRIDADEYADGRTLQPITGFRTGLIGSAGIETHYGRVVSYGIRRREFDHFLLERAAVPARLGEPLTSIERIDGCWRINGDIEAHMLIGAGGHFCPVARHVGSRRGRELSVVAAQEIEFEIPVEQIDRVSVAPQVPELFFCGDLKGYGWCFRKHNFLNIGLGRVDSAGLSEHVTRFCDFLRTTGKVNCDIPQRFHGHAYALYEHERPNVVDDGLLLIGDAAGLAYAQSGEGIRPAVESAVLAADVVAQAEGRYSADQLASYAERLIDRFGRPRSRADWLPAAWLHAAASKLMATQWFSRRFVLDRWFLHAGEPALSP